MLDLRDIHGPPSLKGASIVFVSRIRVGTAIDASVLRQSGALVGAGHGTPQAGLLLVFSSVLDLGQMVVKLGCS